MRNLSYRETAVALALIGAACVASHRLWFMPALAQIERDRHTLEGLVATLARPVRTPSAGATLALPVGSTPALKPALSPPPIRTTKPGVHAPRTPRRTLALPPCDARDPLCGDLAL
jgi:hypothetical protein